MQLGDVPEEQLALTEIESEAYAHLFDSFERNHDGLVSSVALQDLLKLSSLPVASLSLVRCGARGDLKD